MPKFRNKFKGPLSGMSGKAAHNAYRKNRGKFRFKFGVDYDTRKSFFFDAQDWSDIFRPAEYKALNRIGWILMKEARSLIKNRKKESRPYSSPTNWGNEPGPRGRKRYPGALRRAINYGVGPEDKSVWIGPYLHKGAHRGHKTFPEPTIPALLEFGGREWNKYGTLTRRGNYLPAGRVVKIAPRPYMSTAYRRKEKKIIQVLDNFLEGDPISVATAHAKWQSKAGAA